MKKTVMTALAVCSGVALQVQAQVTWPSAVHITTAPSSDGIVGAVASPVPTTKLGLLNFSLNNKFQAYSAGGHWGIEVKPNDPRVRGGSVVWDNISYTYEDAVNCQGVVQYRSNTRVINNATIIGAINKALSWPVGKNLSGRADPTILGGPLVAAASPYKGQFSTKAMLVAVNYDNGRALPPYPPTEDYVRGETIDNPGTYAVWNAPWYLNGLPDNTQPDGTIIPLNWPNQNYISWGKPWLFGDSDFDTWVGARVFIIDPKNANLNLNCFDVTPFFALEESYCYYCWDTMDRVTDGKITFGTSTTAPPCASGSSLCGITGSGTTMFYWTVKFNNVQGFWTDDANAPNYMLSAGFGAGSYYYDIICGFDPTWGDVFGWKLDDTDEPGSIYALGFTVNGVATYPWKFTKLSDGFNWPVGKYSMTASGYGFSPMCGLFAGSVTMTEYDRSNKGFGGDWCISP